MSWLDLVCLIIILYGLIHGLIKGFVLELSSLVGIVLGIIAARLYYVDFASKIELWFDISFQYAKPISFIIIFIAVAIVLHIIALIIDKFLKVIALGWFNRLLGGLFGVIKFVLILSIFINVISALNKNERLISHETTEKSVLFEPIKNTIPVLKSYFLPENGGE
jgi:membrane protein required for colicin V production